MKIVDNFFNLLCGELDSLYFPTVKYYRDNDKCAKVHYTVELFNNGCLTYDKLIIKLCLYCDTTVNNIKSIVDKYIIFE